MKEILPGIYTESVSIGLPEIPSLNLSVIKGNPASAPDGGPARSLLVDAGMEDAEEKSVGDSRVRSCREALDRMMTKLEIPYDRLDCMITHSHQDHIGQVPYLLSRGVRVFLNPEEKIHQRDLVFFQAAHGRSRRELLHAMGLSREDGPDRFRELREAIGKKFENCDRILDFPFLPLPCGSMLKYGGYAFETVPLKGHTFGQAGLWDRDRKVIFCADHIMKGIAPFVGCGSDSTGYLGAYLESMRDVKHVYRDCLFLPGHGPAFQDSREEADRIIRSYLDKCSRMIDVLRTAGRPLCISDIAAWVYGKNILSPPADMISSCLLVLAKTYACLLYMKGDGLVTETDRDGVVYWIAKMPS